MGESYFELEFLHDPAHTKEVYRFIYFQRPYNIMLYILLGIAAIANLFTLFLSVLFLTVDATSIVLFIVIWGFLPLRFLLYRSRVKQTEKQQTELSGGMIRQARIELYNDNFVEIAAHGGKLTIPYSSIKRCYQTKNMFFLHSKTNLFYYLPKSAFVKGNPSYFIPFIVSRGVKA